LGYYIHHNPFRGIWGYPMIEEISGIGGLKIQIWQDDFQHALDGHPEVTLDRVKIALQSPLAVIESKHSKNACLFYTLEGVDEKTKERTYFCVVVAVLGGGVGKMETAYETTYMKSGKVLHGKEE
jgi:hypothetical protein